MKMFSDCSGPCLTCRSTGHCLAGHGDDDYSAISQEEALARLERGRHGPDRFNDKPGRFYTPDELTTLRKHAGLDPYPGPGPQAGEWPECCGEAEQHIRWNDTPQGGDWTIDLAKSMSVARVRLLFCPWCGARLHRWKPDD